MTTVCVDYDGTISADPQFYRCVMRGLMKGGEQVHVLSGDPGVEKSLGQFGLLKGRDFTRSAVVPIKGIARFKVAYMRHVGATRLIDNRAKNCRAAVEAGFTALHQMNPKGPS